MGGGGSNGKNVGRQKRKKPVKKKERLQVRGLRFKLLRDHLLGGEGVGHKSRDAMQKIKRGGKERGQMREERGRSRKAFDKTHEKRVA